MHTSVLVPEMQIPCWCIQVLLHCYALDCASHFLLHPYGTHSIERDEDLEMMEELSYHNSLMSMVTSLCRKQCWYFSENLAQYRWPTLTHIFEKIIKPRPAPIANTYVLESSKKPDLGEHTLAYKLHHSKDSFQSIQIAAECSRPWYFHTSLPHICKREADQWYR